MTRRFLTTAAICAVALFSSLTLASDDPHSGPAMNYHAINARLATGGHFVGDGASRLAADGLAVVIDLRETPPGENAKRLRALGVEYINVPVSWQAPTLEQYENFRDAMKRYSNKQVLVQCAANYRASAMTYLYRVLVDDVDKTTASADRAAAWPLNDTWRKYLANVVSTQATGQ